MPHLYRTLDGLERKPSTPLSFLLADGSIIEGVWAGSAMEEKLDWWLRKAGHQLAQSEPVAAVAAKADDNGEIIWGDTPTQARLIFVLEAPALDKTGRPYRLAKMVTTAATSAQAAYFRHNRSSLFGQLQPDGTIHKISPLTPPPPVPPAQGE